MIGDNLRGILKAKGLTQAQLAQGAHISQSTVSAILNGTTPTENTLNGICEFLGIAQDILLSEKTTLQVNVCPRCNSKALIEWYNHGNGNCRIRCAYCEADTGEQRSREQALHVFSSFQTRSSGRRARASVYVLSLAELLDSAYADADDVRPVWFENRGLFIVPALMQYGRAERELDIVKVLWFGSMSAKSYLLGNYGIAWRCWNSKPTEEHSDAEPWQ